MTVTRKLMDFVLPQRKCRLTCVAVTLMSRFRKRLAKNINKILNLTIGKDRKEKETGKKEEGGTERGESLFLYSDMQMRIYRTCRRVASAAVARRLKSRRRVKVVSDIDFCSVKFSDGRIPIVARISLANLT